MKNYKTILLALMVAPAVSPLCADWQVVENFENADPDEILTWNANADGFWGQHFIVTPPVAETNNEVYYQDPMHSGEQFSIIYGKWDLPGTGVEQGTTATLYFRWYQEGPDHNVNIGLSDIAPNTTADELRPNAGPMSYGDFESQVLFDNLAVTEEGNGFFAVRDGGGFITTDTVIEDNVWINMWMVINNRVQDGVTVFDDTVLYYQVPGGDITALQVPDGAGGYFENFLFRNQTDDPLVALFIATFNDTGFGGVPNSNEQWYVDNVQIDYTGQNLTVPTNTILAGGWAGYSIVNGWVDTGDFMGWLYVAHAPWVYSSSLNSYIYLPEANVSAEGGWAFVLK